MNQINLDMSEIVIYNMSKQKFKKVVKKHINSAAFSEFNEAYFKSDS